MGYVKATANSDICYYHDPSSSPIGEVLTQNNVDSLLI
jgi:hypothetical protein